MMVAPGTMRAPTAHPRQAPMPQAIALSMDAWQATPCAAVMPTTHSSIGSGPRAKTTSGRRAARRESTGSVRQTLVAGTAVVGGGVNRQVQCGEILQAQELRTGAPAEKHLALQGIQSAGHQVLRQKNGRGHPHPARDDENFAGRRRQDERAAEGPSTSRVSPIRRAAKRAVPLPTTL